MVIDTMAGILSSVFSIPSNYFTFPNIIFYFIIPFICAVWFWYVLLSKKVRIFRSSNWINGVLAFVISFFNVTMLQWMPPSMWVPVLVGISFLLSGNFSGKRLIAALIIGGIIAFFYPVLMGANL